MISGAPPTTVEAGQAYSFTPTPRIPDGQALTFSVANRPSWATIQHDDGPLVGDTPTAAASRVVSNVSISVSDGAAQATLPPFTIVVDCAEPAAGDQRHPRDLGEGRAGL